MEKVQKRDERMMERGEYPPEVEARYAEGTERQNQMLRAYMSGRKSLVVKGNEGEKPDTPASADGPGRRAYIIQKVDVEDEKKTLTGLIVSTKFCGMVLPRVDASLFDMPDSRTMFSWIKEYFQEFHEAPKGHIQDLFDLRSKSMQPENAELMSNFLAALSKKYGDTDDEEVEKSYNADFLWAKIAAPFFRSQLEKQRFNAVSDLRGKGKHEAADELDEGYQEKINKLKQADNSQMEINSVEDMEKFVLNIDDFVKLDIPPKETILAPWLTEQSIIQIEGWRGTGKTWFAFSLLDAITKGKDFGPWKISKSVPCLYVESDMADSDVQKRTAQLGEKHKDFYVYSDAYASRMGYPRTNLLDPKWRDTIKKLMLKWGVKVWVVDNLASMTPGDYDELLATDYAPIDRFFLDLRFSGITTIFLHHEGKDQKRGGRGTSSREDHLDTSIQVFWPKDYEPEQGCRFTLRFTKSRFECKDGSLISDMEFWLKHDEKGGLRWVWGGVKRRVEEAVLELLEQGHSQAEIHRTLDISEARVSQIRGKLEREGKFRGRIRDLRGGLSRKT